MLENLTEVCILQPAVSRFKMKYAGLCILYIKKELLAERVEALFVADTPASPWWG